MPRRAKYILKDIDPNEFSLVPIGENGKRFFLYKSHKNGELDAMKEIIKKVLDGDLADESKLDEILKGASASEDSQQTIKAALRLLNAADVSQEVKKSLFETAGVLPVEEETRQPEPPEVSEDNANPGGESMEVLKGLDLSDEAAQKIEEILKSREDESNERIEKMAQDLKAERDARLNKEYISKASTFGNLGIEASEFGPVLKELSERYPEGYEKVTEVLKKADTQIGESKLFDEVGTSTTNDAGFDAWAKIEKMADEMIQKSTESVTKADAINAVLKTPKGSELYAEYDNQQNGRV